MSAILTPDAMRGTGISGCGTTFRLTTADRSHLLARCLGWYGQWS
ncbi:hypothetical protein [Mycobacterium sp. ACS4331]|nr:hypothetical protein [Mycobacterium sp. ACS4331]